MVNYITAYAADRVLAGRIREGDQHAFRELFDATHANMYRRAFRILKNA